MVSKAENFEQVGYISNKGILIRRMEKLMNWLEKSDALDGAPGETGAVNRVFRAFHTLKGSAALFDWPAMLAVLHAAEDGLAAARTGRRAGLADAQGQAGVLLDDFGGTEGAGVQLGRRGGHRGGGEQRREEQGGGRFHGQDAG